ncbi:hypothetical protein N9Y42_04375 [Mariniblastus sp.]|nr:hypothetical protein [Mariniblastus sp.]
MNPSTLISFPEWLASNALLFLIVVLAAIIVSVMFGFLVAAFRHGASEGFYVVANVIGESIPDFLRSSPRRIWAIAMLAIKEALRRKVVLATFAIFALTLLFGGWFMNANSEKPDKIYVNFVMFGTQLLVLMMGMLISSFSLPDDIKNKTIYTIVTKPVRATEIVMGRMLGFGLLGTLLLALMGLLSYFFVINGLRHEHRIVDRVDGNSNLIGVSQTLDSFVKVTGEFSTLDKKRISENAILEAQTDRQNGHSHRLEVQLVIRSPSEPKLTNKTNIISERVLDDGSTEYQLVVCSTAAGHTHRVFVEGEGESAKITLGPPVGFFRARIPIFANSLQFYDRNGDPAEKGINVGNENMRRSYISGGSPQQETSLAKVEFNFENFYESDFPNLRKGDDGEQVLPLEMDIAVFRSYKNDVEKRVTAGIQFESVPDEAGNRFVSEMKDFETNEFTIQTLPISRKWSGKVLAPDGTLIEQGKYDLFDDYAKNGKLKLTLKCRDYNQYLGVAQPDVYFRPSDAPYAWNFFKGYVGIWCQMLIVIAIGVALSTSLSAPITMLGTIVIIVLGFFSSFVQGLVDPASVGGGPFESFIRVVTQQNMVTDLDTGWFDTIIENADFGLSYLLYGLAFLAPDFSKFNFSNELASGYSISNSRLLIAMSLTFVFCVGFTLLGYFSLKTREIAK